MPLIVRSTGDRRLVTTWRMLMDPALAEEGFTKITHEIHDLGDGSCSLTLVHELEGAPKVALLVSGALEHTGAGGGHPWILSDLESLLETGSRLAG